MDDFDFENRIVSTDATSEDNENEVSLRPFDMDEYIGQEKAKEILKIYIDAVKLRGDYLDHVLLYGPPGLGKTTLIRHNRRRTRREFPRDLGACN